MRLLIILPLLAIRLEAHYSHSWSHSWSSGQIPSHHHSHSFGDMSSMQNDLMKRLREQMQSFGSGEWSSDDFDFPTQQQSSHHSRGSSGSGGSSAKSQILNDHNKYRARHGAPALRFDDSLNRNAQAQAEKLARHDSGLSHSSHNENLFSASGMSPTSATHQWYSEEPHYDYNYGGHSSSTGHFTALVWRSSTHLGVGIAQSGSGNVYVVAQYWPAGNVAGHYRQNVRPPQ